MTTNTKAYTLDSKIHVNYNYKMDMMSTFKNICLYPEINAVLNLTQTSFFLQWADLRQNASGHGAQSDY